MRVEVATAEQIYQVGAAMRDRDYAEFSAMSHVADREMAAQGLVDRYAGLSSVRCAMMDDGTPVGIGGPLWLRPNVATLLFYATDDFTKLVHPLTRYMRHTLMPSVKAEGAHRIECMSLATYTEMQTWVELFGLRPEARLRAYGRNGEDFISYAWLAKQQ
jgi:hypothetical protein